jgi:hypothetical protein
MLQTRPALWNAKFTLQLRYEAINKAFLVLLIISCYLVSKKLSKGYK